MTKNNYLPTGSCITLEPLSAMSISEKLHAIVDQIIGISSFTNNSRPSFQLFLKMEPGVGIRFDRYMNQSDTFYLSEIKSSSLGKSLWTLWKKNSLDPKDKMFAIVALNQD
jgi:hypothetical protein